MGLYAGHAYSITNIVQVGSKSEELVMQTTRTGTVILKTLLKYISLVHQRMHVDFVLQHQHYLYCFLMY